MALPKDNLYVSNKRASVKGMSCVGVAKVMRGKSVQATKLSGLLDRPLDIGLVATPADLVTRARIMTELLQERIV
jgi:hypothetical protein